MILQSIIPFGEYILHRFEHPESKSGFAIVPERGGCLLEVTLKGTQVLDGYQTPDEVRLNRWGKNMPLFPFPNRLKNGQYTWKGKDYQFPINDINTENALHGFGMDALMSLEDFEIEEDKVEMICSFRYEGELDEYPFPFTFFLTFTLEAPSNFTVEMKVKNDGKEEIPMGLGWHPYFKLSEKIEACQLQFPPCRLVGIDERMLPTGKTYEYDDFEKKTTIGATILDNCFRLNNDHQGAAGIAKTILSHNDQKLTFWQETGKDKFNFLQVFTHPYRTSIAIEPMTCNVDAFNNGDGLKALAAGEEFGGKFGFYFE